MNSFFIQFTFFFTFDIHNHSQVTSCLKWIMLIYTNFMLKNVISCMIHLINPSLHKTTKQGWIVCFSVTEYWVVCQTLSLEAKFAEKKMSHKFELVMYYVIHVQTNCQQSIGCICGWFMGQNLQLFSRYWSEITGYYSFNCLTKSKVSWQRCQWG